MTSRQRAILEFVRQNGEITVAYCATIFGAHYYGNAHKHAGAVLSRLVSRHVLQRAARGRYVAAPPPPFLRRTVWHPALKADEFGTLGTAQHLLT